MTKDLDIGEPRFSAGERSNGRQYLKEFVPAMALYSALLIGALMVGNDSTFGRILIVLVPVLPFALVTRAIVRHLARVDEFQRMITLQAIGIGFAAAMFAALIVGFLGVANVDLDGGLGGWIPFMVGMGTWGVVSTRSSRA